MNLEQYISNEGDVDIDCFIDDVIDGKQSIIGSETSETSAAASSDRKCKYSERFKYGQEGRPKYKESWWYQIYVLDTKNRYSEPITRENARHHKKFRRRFSYSRSRVLALAEEITQ